jgi:hypothetical protein
VLTFLIAFSFRFTALGHAEDFIEQRSEPVAEPA